MTVLVSNHPNVSSTKLPTTSDLRPSLDHHSQARKTSTSSRSAKPSSSSQTASHSLSTRPSVAAFRKKKPPSSQNQPSALTARLQAKSAIATNPFYCLYGGISGREDSHYTLQVHFPHSDSTSASRARSGCGKDVSVVEVIGHALWRYCDHKATPQLDENIPEGVDKKVRLSSAGWCLRMDTEGEVDEDYPGAFGLWSCRSVSLINESLDSHRQSRAHICMA
jgi:hypothetical protein